ncbi:MAG TPA: adenylate/guanylate cyclase domain-containing protein [Lapillicoccus sp.]
MTARTVTMLFTDIERSTVLLRRLGARWADALGAHRTLVREAVEAAGGEVMGTEGDSFFVVFESAHEALRAAVTAQRGLQAYDWPEGEPLRVRMGLHTGEPERHGEGYIGEDVHLAARIGATSHGGQIVASETTRRLVAEMDGPLLGVAFRDLGRHRLKDIEGDTHLYDVVVPGLESRFPPLRSLGRRAALPTPRTALVGREVDVEEVVRLVADGTRLLTLTGPGAAARPGWRWRPPRPSTTHTPTVSTSSPWTVSRTRTRWPAWSPTHSTHRRRCQRASGWPCSWPTGGCSSYSTTSSRSTAPSTWSRPCSTRDPG